MIRYFEEKDIKFINIIGNSIKNNFDISKIYNKSVEQVYVYEQENNIIGFIHICNILNDVDILNIAVEEKYRNKNIASMLIEHIIEEINPNKIILEVRKNNIAAINLYKKYNFNVIHERKKYYGDESALIMELILK